MFLIDQITIPFVDKSFVLKSEKYRLKTPLMLEIIFFIYFKAVISFLFPIALTMVADEQLSLLLII